jgi:ribonuclease HII
LFEYFRWRNTIEPQYKMPKRMPRPDVTINDMYLFENQLHAQGFSLIMGLDEVGRGCLAGPVVAAGVILNPEKPIEGLNDSKKLSATRREELAPLIHERALCCVIREASVEEIDSINILKAAMLAMHRCVEAALPQPGFLLVDGNYFPPLLIPHQTIVKGDARSASIAAASIVAKVYRDRLMAELGTQCPGYAWDENAGYGTEKHRDGIKKLGLTQHHRRSFRLDTGNPES